MMDPEFRRSLEAAVLILSLSAMGYWAWVAFSE